MKLSKFNFELPEKLIAQYPKDFRDDSRLMVIHRDTGKIEHKKFSDIVSYFNEDDVMIVNNSKVFPARLRGKKEKTDADIEVFLLRELKAEEKLWDVLVDPARKIRIGNKLYFGEDNEVVAEIIDNTTSRGRTLRFSFDGTYEEFKATIDKLGRTPLPPSIKRESEVSDREKYQTIFAKHEGSIAAPTAGMHFSKNIIKRFEIKGVDFEEVTLHVGLGNFRRVDVEDLTKHKMDSENINIPQKTADRVNRAKKENKQRCAIGTTVVRALESSVSTKNELNIFSGWTNKFIFPPRQIRIPTSMVTNFHLPYSTALMTVAAFAGYNLIFDAYRTAIKEKYHFGAFGDAMLII